MLHEFIEYPMLVDQVIGLAVAALVCVAIALVHVLIKEIQSQQPVARTKPQKTASPDGKLLQRILIQLRKDYPDRDESWYWQKAQRELIDRRTQAPPLKLVTGLPSASNPLKLPKLTKHSTLEVFDSTEKKLYGLVNGDMKTSDRLLESVRYRNPGRSEQWIWEKVIYDLERDRRA